MRVIAMLAALACWAGTTCATEQQTRGGAAGATAAAVTVPAVGSYATGLGSVAAMPHPPPGYCYTMDLRKMLQYDKSGHPRFVRCALRAQHTPGPH